MDENEKLVRETWNERVVLQIAHEEGSWLAAAEFTRKHLERVAKLLASKVWVLRKASKSSDIPEAEPLVALIDSALADLHEGMKLS